ncbi:MAG: hypothetical protein HY909_20605 [Deltaproteobacteria bacterium]|nr:hypothetical protein [Deltaproteobacteria bacterium]
MDEGLVDTLCRRAATMADPIARVQFFRSVVLSLPLETLERLAEALTERAGWRDPDARSALLTLQIARAQPPQLFPEEPATDAPLPGDHPSGDPLGADRAERGAARVPDYGRGRVLTLGERKSLARKPDRRVLERVLADPHPDVIALLLQNPRLTEPDVVRLCSRRPGVPDILQRVFATQRWASRAGVRSALVKNPYTPRAIALSIVALLPAEELREVAADWHLPNPVRRRCLEILARLRPTPQAPLGELH